jgi:hypothetical protein
MALKVMHPRLRAERDYLRRFQTEARSAAKLHHINIVPVFDYGEQDGVCYHAMQCIVGVGLDRVLNDVRRLRAGADRDTEARTKNVGQATVIDAGADSLPAISRGLLTGRFANPPMASRVAGLDPTAISASDGPAPVAISGARSQADGWASTPSGGGSESGRRSIAGQPEPVYRVEAESVLAGPTGELPADVFANPR